MMSVPLGASILPVLFLLGAFLHADKYDLLRLKNNTDVPYVSDIGNYKPYSSVFTLGLNFNAMFGFWLILVRHIQVDKIFENTGSKANRSASFFGFLGIMGELTVGSFQLSSHLVMHYLGAFVFFASIMIYMCIQTFITCRNRLKVVYKEYSAILIAVRVILSALLLISLVIFGTFLHPSLSAYNRKGYSVAQSAEWVMLACVIIFMMTFLYDFNNLAVSIDYRKLDTSVVLMGNIKPVESLYNHCTATL